MITLHTIYNYPPMLKGNVRDLRAVWALEELGLPFEFHWLDFAARQHRGEAARRRSVFGRIPALEDGDTSMFESAAIVLYLYDRSGKGPKDAEARAQLNQWCFAALNTVEPVFFEMLRWDFFWTDRPGRAWRYPELLTLARERLGDLEGVLARRDWLVGGAFGPADILMLTALDFGRGTPEIFEDYPAVTAYRARGHARPAHARALALQGAGPAAA
ncbi:MAG TPA: glutathione S-transferase family protein [Rhizomicrobium sp.]|jgi:glutathione S-transferase|nr:glutathione S-transferase family protein [Rhizomicrobium sp.]